MKKLHLFKRTLLLLALIVGFVNYGWAETVTYTVTSTSAVSKSGTAPTGSSASYSSTYGTACQLTKSNSMTLTLSGYAGYRITNITLSMKSNTSGGSGNLSYSTDNGSTYTDIISTAAFNSSSWHGSWSTSYVDISKNVTIIPTSSALKIKIAATANSLYCQSFKITYEAAKTLDHITLSGTYPTSFTEQDEFSHEGMTVTANYDDSSSKDVTSSATFTGYDMDEIGNQTVTVSYTEGNTTKTATYDITINAGEKYTVSFDPEAGTCGTDYLTESAYKGGVILPAATIGLDGWVFAGWATAPTASTTTRPTLYKSGRTYYPTANTTLHAVYTLDGVNYEKYQRATTLDQITSANQIAIVNASKILDNNLGGVDAPEETDGFIDEPSSDYIWTLSGDNTDGFTLTNGDKTIGTAATLPSTSGNLQLSSNHNNWLFVESTNGTNNFVVRNKELNSDSKVGSIDYNSGWKIYFLSSNTYTGNSSVASKIYVPVSTVFNSNPTQAIITPVVSFNSSDAKTLYLDGTKTYTNAASVTEVDKSVTGYKSSNESVATVDASGVVTAVGIGTATITAYLDIELGVHKAAEASYEVTVKNTTTIAGLKALYNAAQNPAKAFAADLTDAVVTYVNGNHAYIQDATGAIYASCGSSLTAGKKINGAVSGTITAPNTIDEIKTIDLSAATVTEDGIIPAAEVKTLAQIKAGDYDGKLVTVNGATVSTGMNNATSGGVITDDGGTTTINIIAPNKLTLKATEIGNFTGFVSIYNGETYRLNLYDASQYQKTRNVETAQTLSFAEDAIALDEETAEFAAFTGQTVEGAQGTVTYALTGDAIGSVNASTGVVTLNGAYGTATITATAAAKEVTVDGVTTPYTETEESYTVTVRPRYMVTFSVNGVETVLRQATFGASIAVPTPSDFDDYKFMGWSESTVAPTDDEPSMTDLGATVIPTDNDDKYYAVYAQERAGGEENRTSEFVIKTSSTPSNPIVIDGVTWTYSGIDFVNSASACMPGNSTVTFALPNDALNAVSVEITSTSNIWAGSTKLSLPLTDKDDNVLTTLYKDNYSYDFTSKDNKVGPYTITSTTTDSKKAYIDHITVTYAIIGTENYDYRTSLPNVEVTISESKFLSFCYGSKLDFTETDVKAYKASVDGEGKVTLTKVDVVPAGEGVVLYCETPDTYSIPVTTKDASDVTGNQMVGVLVRTQVVWNPETYVYNYILQQGQFNKANGGYLKANRAYLQTSYNVDAEARALEIVFDEGETTGITNANVNLNANDKYYNLNGQRVATPVKGNIYIVNGKKVMFK